MSVAKHEGEYWLTVNGLRGVLFTRYDGEICWDLQPFPDDFRAALWPLADPEKPVRIRLTMEAEVVDGET